jgi:hypothetical protein
MSNDYTIESTGYSYSGIADILLNEGKGPSLELLSDLLTQFLAAKEECDKLESALAMANEQRKVLVSCFHYAHKALKLKAEEPLVIREGIDCVFVVKMLDDYRINWERYVATIPY